MYCTQCGKENSDTSKFCMYCGAAMEPRLNAVPPPTSPSATPTQRVAQPSAMAPRRQRSGLPPGLKRALRIIGILAIVLLVLAGGAMAAARYWLRLGANETAKMMPAETNVYAVFNPGVRQLTHISDLERLQILGAPLQMLGVVDSGKVQGIFDELDIDFEEDIQSWVGLEAGAGLLNMDSSEEGFVLAIATRNQGASDQFLDKLWTQMEDDGKSFDETTYQGVPMRFEVNGSRGGTTFATVNRFVVITDRPETMEQIIDTVKDGRSQLAANKTYQAVMDRLPGNRLGSVYIDQTLIADFAQEAANFGAIEAFRGMGMSLSLRGGGAQIEIISAYDTDLMSREEMDYMRRDGNKTHIVKALPDDVILVQTGHNLYGSWRSTMAQFPQVDAEDINSFLDDFRYETGIDLEEDLFSTMTGEFALAFMPAKEDILDVGFPVSFLFLSEIRGRDQNDVEQTMDDLFARLADSSGAKVGVRSINGIEMKTIEENHSGLVFGYGMVDDYLVVGTSLGTLRSAADARDNPLADDEIFRAAVKQLPKNNHGIFYLNVNQMVRFLKRSLDGYERRNFEDDVAPYLEPLSAISGASLPLDKKGYQRSILYLQFAD